MARLIAQAPHDFSGRTYAPGEVLPSALHAWRLLPSAVERGAIWVDGEPVASLVDARTGAALDVKRLGPDIFCGLVRRGQVKSVKGDTPEIVAAYATQQVSHRHRSAPKYPARAAAPILPEPAQAPVPRPPTAASTRPPSVVVDAPHPRHQPRHEAPRANRR